LPPARDARAVFIFGAKAGRPGRVLLEMNDAQRIKTKWKNIA
jgi:hypothetical protein